METIINQVATHLVNGGALTVKTCWVKFGTTELRKIVSRLRKRGHRVTTTQLTEMLPNGREVRYNEYRITA